MTAYGGEAAALVAAAVWGISDFCGGLVTRRSTPAVIVMLAHGLSLLVLLALQLFLHAALPDRHTIEYGLLAGLAGGTGLIALYKGLSLGSMGLVAAVSGVMTAVIPVVVSFCYDGRPSAIQLAGFAIAIAAIWLIAYTPSSDAHPNGLGFAVLAGASFGFLLVFLHAAGKGGVLWALTLSRVGSTFCALVALGITMVRRNSGEARGPSLKANWRAIVPLAFTAGILDTSGNLLYTISSLAGRLDVAAVLSSLYPAGTILLAMWLLRERATRAQATGMVLAMIAVAFISL